jgi:vacuolar-type H+-ATPase subunit I/STV1
MEVTNYNGENMLYGANKLNIDIKNFINFITARRENRHPDDKHTLQEYILDIDEYIRDITAYNFAPRTDRLTKEGVLVDLSNTKKNINDLLSSLKIISMFDEKKTRCNKRSFFKCKVSRRTFRKGR